VHYITSSGSLLSLILLDYSFTNGQYTLDILERAGMTDCKPCSTPVDTQGKLSETGGTPVIDPTTYQSFAGAL